MKEGRKGRRKYGRTEVTAGGKEGSEGRKEAKDGRTDGRTEGR
jgi:hypothetical protein